MATNHSKIACEHCGSPDVQWTAWVDAWGVVDSESPDDATWCPACEADEGIDWTTPPASAVGWVSCLPEAGTIVERMADLADVERRILEALDVVQALRSEREAIIARAESEAARQWSEADIDAAKRYARQESLAGRRIRPAGSVVDSPPARR